MTATLTILISDEVLASIRGGKTITLTAVSGNKPAARAAAGKGATANMPREGSLPARLLAWAEKRTKPFGVPDVEKRFKVSRAHASMLLSRVSGGDLPVQRLGRGVYKHVVGGESEAGPVAAEVQPRQGSLPARVLAWSEKRRRTFGCPEVEKAFDLSRAHASMLLSKLAAGDYAIRRVSRGVYEYTGAKGTRVTKSAKKTKKRK